MRTLLSHHTARTHTCSDIDCRQDCHRGSVRVTFLLVVIFGSLILVLRGDEAVVDLNDGLLVVDLLVVVASAFATYS